MRIEIINKVGDLITSFELESNPFKVGEAITIDISNFDKNFWTVKELTDDFIIEKIEHYFRLEYTMSHQVLNMFTTSVEVSQLL